MLTQMHVGYQRAMPNGVKFSQENKFEESVPWFCHLSDCRSAKTCNAERSAVPTKKGAVLSGMQL